MRNKAWINIETTITSKTAKKVKVTCTQQKKKIAKEITPPISMLTQEEKTSKDTDERRNTQKGKLC